MCVVVGVVLWCRVEFMKGVDMMWMCVFGSVLGIEGAGVNRSPPYVVGSSWLFSIVWDVKVFGVGADETDARKGDGISLPM